MSTTEEQEPTPTMARPELTLIVAATSKMGIGLKGTLPWTGLRKEMAYFKRVTLRSGDGRNAVVMGRKTWDSIPEKFRPLGGRWNVVISRSMPHSPPSSDNGPEIASSLDAAISLLSSSHGTSGKQVEKAFIIGGAQIYKAALERPETRRVLLTRILDEFECDTFFPIVLGESGVGEASAEGWKRRPVEELRAWTGEE
ncbi:hypothetical protein HYFRA_00011870, partial [Hymenoscyphus fraxineus]